jgi:hypothetical protein
MKTVPLLTDSQILDEQFLIFVLNFLSTGVPPDIFSQEDNKGFFQLLKVI